MGRGMKMAVKARGTLDERMVEPKRHSFFVDLLLRLVREKPLGTVGLVIVLVLLLTGIFADYLAPYPMGKISWDILQGPTSQHLLGTDNLGRDVLSQIIYGARVSVIIGLSATALTTVVSIIIGALSAQIGGKFDLLMQRFVDAFMCVPGFLILLIMVSIMGKGMWQIIVAIGLPMGIGGSRMIRSAVLGIRENTYIDAGRAIGCSNFSMLRRHILPNIMPVIIIGFSMMVGGAILMEASLSFLGFGVPPGVPSWGSMLSQEGRIYMEIEPMLAIWPGLALTLVVWGTNMFGDALRDLLDPRLKGGLGRYGGPKKKVKIKIKL
jgi:peptide/nickel transport system permease protein